MITSNFKSTPDSTPGAISISRYAPRYKRYKSYKALAPGAWYRTAEVNEYVPLYFDILSKLDAQTVYDELIALAAPYEPILLCYEDVSKDWCHRRFVADWIHAELGIEVPEGKFINGACVPNSMQYDSIPNLKLTAEVSPQLNLF